MLLSALLATARAYSERASESGCTAKAVYPNGDEFERECIVEGEGKAAKKKSSGGASGGISSEFGWMKDTRWNWNNWREVIFRSDGSFLAPAENCEREGNPACRWYTVGDDIKVEFGGAGTHTLQATSDQTMMHGSRDRDGDQVSATIVG